MKKILKVFLVVLLLFTMVRISDYSVKADYCDEPVGNPFPPDVCPG